MQIIEFLLSHITWVVVIGGFLLTMLSRSRRAGADGGQPRAPRMPTFGGGPDDREPGTWLPGGPRAARGASAEAQPTPAASAERAQAARVSVGAAAPPPERGSLTAAAVAGEAAEAARAAERRSGEPAGAAAGLQADAEAVRQGVVWAEVLGPPRARKPYSYRK